jgi:hypothetical protein
MRHPLKAVPSRQAIKIVDLGVERVIRADRDEWVPVFTGLSVRQFRRLVRIVAGRGGEQTGTGRAGACCWLTGCC